MESPTYPPFFEELLSRSIESGATDLHLGPGSSPAVRIDGIIAFLSDIAPLSAEETTLIAQSLLSENEYRELQSGKEIDASMTYQDHRFRAHAFHDHRGTNLAIRFLPAVCPPIDTLGIPDALKRLVLQKEGLILIVGPTGAGKTTTRSALIEYVNTLGGKHIISLEDTIEYQFENTGSFIQQRRIGSGGDSASYSQAITAALREDPDIISVGDLRDRNAIAAALTAAQTGHLVLAELHASNSVGAIQRLVGNFPVSEQQSVSEQLAQSLVGIVSQQLVPQKNGGRILASEMLINTGAIQNHIRTNTTEHIPSLLKTNRDKGMFHMDDHLAHLATQDVITPETAQAFSSSL